VITVENLRVRYPNGTLAIDDLSLRVTPGEFVAIVGPSGCGKSTLLRAIAGLVRPTEGTIVRKCDSIGFVFQDPTLLPWRNVRRNVELVGELLGLERATRRARALDAIARVGLTEFGNARPATLSGGMRMRASVARALVTRPALLLFDEPFAGVDELSRARLGEDLLELREADRFTGLVVTHSVAEAVFLADRVVVMSERPGRVAGEVRVPFGSARPPAIRFEPRFTDVAARVHALLAGEGT
jgi:NitT/TauT family transport system ATP-binding protein